MYVHMRGRALLFAGTQVFTVLLKNHVYDLKFQFRAPKWTKMRFGNFPLLGYQTRALVSPRFIKFYEVFVLLIVMISTVNFTVAGFL